MTFMKGKWSKGIIQTVLESHELAFEDILNTTSSAIINDNYPEYAFNYNNYNKIFESKENNTESFFKLELKNFSVTLNAYRIKSSFHGLGASHLKSWDFYGSNDDNEWTLLDRVTNEKGLNGKLYEKIFYIQNPIESFQYYLICNVTSYYLPYKIMFSEFDIYDTIFSPLIHHPPCTLSQYRLYQISSFCKISVIFIAFIY